MSRSKGKRSNTRNSFSRAFKKHGQEHSSTYIQNFKLGEYVDIFVNSSVQKGLPYKFYHGKTGKIFNITKFSAGVEVEKKVGNKKVIKRLNIRLEHLIKSKSRINFFEKLKNRDLVRRFSYFSDNKPMCFKKIDNSKRQGHFIIFKKLINIDPEPYSIVV